MGTGRAERDRNCRSQRRRSRSSVVCAQDREWEIRKKGYGYVAAKKRGSGHCAKGKRAEPTFFAPSSLFLRVAGGNERVFRFFRNSLGETACPNDDV